MWENVPAPITTKVLKYRACMWKFMKCAYYIHIAIRNVSHIFMLASTKTSFSS